MPSLSRRSLLARLPALGALPVLGPLTLKLAPVADEVPEDAAPLSALEREELEGLRAYALRVDSAPPLERWRNYALKLQDELDRLNDVHHLGGPGRSLP